MKLPTLQELFPFTYQGGGHFRHDGIPVGKPAATLHGAQAVEFLFAAFAKWMAENSFEVLRQEYISWSQKTFPDQTRESIWTHFLEEVEEMRDAPHDGSEFADVFALLLCLAHKSGVDLVEELRKKFAINKGRTWVQTPAGMRHERPTLPLAIIQWDWKASPKVAAVAAEKAQKKPTTTNKMIVTSSQTPVPFGIVPILPLRDFPAGRARIRLRDDDFPRVHIKTPDGLRTFYPTEKDGHWIPFVEQDSSTRVESKDYRGYAVELLEAVKHLAVCGVCARGSLRDCEIGAEILELIKDAEEEKL